MGGRRVWRVRVSVGLLAVAVLGVPGVERAADAQAAAGATSPTTPSALPTSGGSGALSPQMPAGKFNSSTPGSTPTPVSEVTADRSAPRMCG